MDEKTVPTCAWCNTPISSGRYLGEGEDKVFYLFHPKCHEAWKAGKEAAPAVRVVSVNVKAVCACGARTPLMAMKPTDARTRWKCPWCSRSLDVTLDASGAANVEVAVSKT